ncbi:hypothetical protein [Pasteuria penetrans]|uniref:hypothetical protein n=1 Tax=Pasteuria penetrans TaxID=86005 RepID=UPI00165CC64E
MSIPQNDESLLGLQKKDRPRKKGVKWEPIRSRIYQDIFHVLDKKEALHGLIRFSG